jgi:hypothetical protein
MTIRQRRMTRAERNARRRLYRDLEGDHREWRVALLTVNPRPGFFTRRIYTVRTFNRLLKRCFPDSWGNS